MTTDGAKIDLPSRRTPTGGRSVRVPVGRAYTLIEVVVSLAIIALIVTALLPAMQRARSAAYRVICASNLRELGTGLTVYATDMGSRPRLAPSVFLPEFSSASPAAAPGAPKLLSHESVTLKLEWDHPLRWATADRSGFDGLGLLFAADIITSPELFYCPAHPGTARYSDYANRWYEGQPDRLLGNYQYRGLAPNLSRDFNKLVGGWSLVADGLRTAGEFNHESGVNVLDGALSVGWVDDNGRIASALPLSTSDATAMHTEYAWDQLDRELRSGSGNASNAGDN